MFGYVWLGLAMWTVCVYLLRWTLQHPEVMKCHVIDMSEALEESVSFDVRKGRGSCLECFL